MSKDNTAVTEIKLQASANITLLQKEDALCEGCTFYGTSEKLAIEGEFFTVATDARANELIKAGLAKKA